MPALRWFKPSSPNHLPILYSKNGKAGTFQQEIQRESQDLYTEWLLVSFSTPVTATLVHIQKLRCSVHFKVVGEIICHCGRPEAVPEHRWNKITV